MRTELLIFLWCFHFATVVVAYVAFMSILAMLFGTRITAIDVGLPPRIFIVRIRHVRVALGLIPFSSSVQFLNESDRSDDGQTTDDAIGIYGLSLGKQLIVIMGGTIIFLTVALACLGFADFAHHATLALPHLFKGALHPQTTGQVYLHRFSQILSKSPMEATGILACTYFMWNLIPYFPSPTYRALSAILRYVTGRELPTNLNLPVALLLMSPCLVPLVGWTIALGMFCFTVRT